MNSIISCPKKSPSSKARRKVGTARCAVRKKGRTSQRDVPTIQLPTQLERDTLLTPEWVAESVVQEAERFLKADLPEGFAERLAAKAQHLYPRHKHFRQMLNRPGNTGRNNLYMFMRHWTAGWLKRERSALYKKLPWSFGQGRALPVMPPGVPKNYPAAKQLVTEDCIRPGKG